MAGQGKTTIAIAEQLQKAGWTVVFRCVPNTTHIGVVPIPIMKGSANQRYPDILSFRDHVLRLTEVEMTLTEDVAEKIIERFNEQMTALMNPETWISWRSRVAGLTGHVIPPDCKLSCELVVCSPVKDRHIHCITRLSSLSIVVYNPLTYVTS